MASETSTAAQAPAAVRRRRVIYVHGFDPRGPAPYHRMFAEEAARAAALAGGELETGPRRRSGAKTDAWTISARFEDQVTTTVWEFARWDDVVRGLWLKPGLQLYGRMWRSLAVFQRTGTLTTARRRARPLALALLLGPVVTSALMAVAILGGMGAAALAWGLAEQIGAPGWAVWLVALAALVLPTLVARELWRRLDGLLRIAWLVRSIDHCAEAARGRAPEADAFAKRLGERIVEAAKDADIDELLVIGHSFGAPMAVQALAHALRIEPDLGAGGRLNLALLTLAQPIAPWTQIAGAGAFRDDLTTVANARQIPWLDVTSPSDGVTSSWLDPTDGIVGAQGRPIRRSPHFHLILEPDRFRYVRLRPFDFHFQYLKTPDRAEGFNLYRLACGPDRLQDFERAWTRYADDRA